MNSKLAHECLRRLICSVLRQSGFDAASPDALVELEDKMGMLLGGLLHIAHGYAELARRTRPVAFDFMKACENQGISIPEMEDLVEDNKATKDEYDDIPIRLKASTSTPPPDTDPIKHFLPDSEDDTHRKASYAPDFLPVLPPSHSYMRTPVYASIATPEQAQVAGIPIVDMSRALEYNQQADIEGQSADARITQLDARIRTTRLVEASLQNLIRATSKASQKTIDGSAQNDDVDGDITSTLAKRKQSRENLLVLLKKYERDAAVCNFELEWYPAGGVKPNVSEAITKDAIPRTQVNQFAGPQRKRGRWKV